jgi:sigma-B regulation protein RsbU (phosphoserine phosphatase)
VKNLFFNLGKGKGEKPKDSGLHESTTVLTGDDRIDARNIRLLLDTMAELISDVELGRLFVSVVDRAIRLTGAERGLLFLYDGSTELKIRVARDARGHDLPAPVQYSTHVTSRVAAEGTPICLKVGDDRVMDLSQSVVDLKLRAVMCVTLRVKEEVLGVIYVDSKASAREFTRSDVRFFDALASALAIAIYNARLVVDALEKERLKESLAIAHSIQSALFPPDPTGIPGFDIAGFCVACESTAGDYYDFIRLSDGRLGLVLGDVSGHGIGPSLLMTSARSLMRAHCEGSIVDVVRRTNEQFVQDVKDGMFMSLFFGVLDPIRASLSYVNAGQTPPMLLRAGGGCEDLETTGVALGIEPGFEYTAGKPLHLEVGDLLAIFSDGVIEARNASGELFGRERLAQALVRLRGKSAKEILAGVKQALTTYLAGVPAGDDVSFAIVKSCPR